MRKSWLQILNILLKEHIRVCECSLCTKCQYKYVHVLVLSIVTGSVVGLVQMKHLIILYINIEKKKTTKRNQAAQN